MSSPLLSSIDFPAEICQRTRTFVRETRVRCHNRGLKSSKWRLRRPDITTARRYYDGIQLPAIPVVETTRREGGRSRFTIRWNDGAARTSFWPVRELAVTFSSPYTPKLYHVFSSFSLFVLSDACARSIPAGTLAGIGWCTSIIYYRWTQPQYRA